MAGTSTKRFPLYAKDYELYEEVGEGVSATVYRARCIALNENVAIKIMDLENAETIWWLGSPIHTQSCTITGTEIKINEKNGIHRMFNYIHKNARIIAGDVFKNPERGTFSGK
ncbi:hypothetical protein Bca52824_083954 [Brassica carinata]|uniref:Protein kinase domain-containing protein n=1 Tax=Brassica carinata TaxID=52824 RepID=A0A8X7PNA8_BRACI|nr:hypothetical protein Bca52824_083954 [Brassica carinata]